MQTRPQNVLFLVTGMTPAIITETIWALACDPELDEEDRWIPDRVEVLSTESGLTQIRDVIIQGNVLQQMQKDFPQLKHLVLNGSCLHSIKNAKNEVLDDLKTPDDNEFAADQINEHIRQLTESENTCLHVSIAGGRKTMGFYAGYALSLHGRAQDRMSHVLVEEKYEGASGFFYPAPKPEKSYVKHKVSGKSMDAYKAKVWLAEIPFVRMKDAIIDKHQLKSDDSFSQVVTKIKNSFSPAKLTINLDSGKAILNGIEVVLPPREFAFLHWFADMRRNGEPGAVCPRIKNADKNVSTADAAHLANITKQFAKYYSEQKANTSGDLSVDKTLFNTTVSHLKTQLTAQLGLESAAKFQIKYVGRRGNPFFLDVPAENITIIDSIK